ncbi:DUF192 domain-containing protein [Anaerovorax odorimutans]|uniref:DUF192 domain-containing protein n=1 Tax=Anaerovorax odorimutans TaxID=109327 RepID=UPI000410AC6A|nr:DUF192 domain-containing protein [Anaerovorax odorimutans]
MIAYSNDIFLADKIHLADNFIKRFLGFMGRKELNNGEGLLLLNTPLIHCFFMRITIDAVYLSKDMKVLGIETLKPWSIGTHFKKTSHVLELKKGTISLKVKVGDTIIFK